MQVELGDGVVVMQKVFTTPLEQLFTLMWDNNADLFTRFHNLRKDTSTFEIVGWGPDCRRGRGTGTWAGEREGTRTAFQSLHPFATLSTPESLSLSLCMANWRRTNTAAAGGRRGSSCRH